MMNIDMEDNSQKKKKDVYKIGVWNILFSRVRYLLLTWEHCMLASAWKLFISLPESLNTKSKMKFQGHNCAF